ncbi:hypothetical protein J1605_021602 [Eschrichtius robustus]|uniref:Uncharacterized protein n=1 Tax=Eschrichtius robustus TaxID=9764 RepID=A0AB34HH51_ESCRO|nr:hypothetical protein J1605_021602 [Eschrichtius robustus]
MPVYPSGPLSSPEKPRYSLYPSKPLEVMTSVPVEQPPSVQAGEQSQALRSPLPSLWVSPISLTSEVNRTRGGHLFSSLREEKSCLQVSILLIRASLVAPWLRIRLPMQGTRVRALVREDPTCRGATKPVRHNY